MKSWWVFYVLLPALFAALPLGAGTGPWGASETSRPQGPQAAANADTDNVERTDLTRDGLRKVLEEHRVALEDLTGRINQDAPTEEQLARVEVLERQIADLDRELAQLKADVDLRAEGDSFYARWLRLRQAFEDITEYDFGDGKLRFDIGVRAQLDGTVPFNTDEELETVFPGIRSSVEARRARVYAEGRFFRTLDFKFEYDFGADLGLKDAYVEGARFTKYFRWRIGNFQEPLSLAKQNGSFDRSYLELPLPVAAVAPGSNFGLMFRHAEAGQRMTWAAAATTSSRKTDDNKSNADLSLTARLTGLPLYRVDGRRLLHLGVSYSVREPSGDTVELAARPEARFLPELVGTGALTDADYGELAGLELGFVHDSLWAQAEWLRMAASFKDNPGLEFGGGYLQVGYVLTGEYRPYDRRAGAFDRVRPTRKFSGGSPLHPKKLGGAFTVSGGISFVDLDSREVKGGRQRNLSLGANWYATGALRLSLNLINAKVEDLGSTNIALLRFQFSP